MKVARLDVWKLRAMVRRTRHEVALLQAEADTIKCDDIGDGSGRDHLRRFALLARVRMKRDEADVLARLLDRIEGVEA